MKDLLVAFVVCVSGVAFFSLGWGVGQVDEIYLETLRGEKQTLEYQVGALEGELEMWKMTSLPALHSVGLRPVKTDDAYPPEVNPATLSRALNPCYDFDWQEEHGRKVDEALCERFNFSPPIVITIAPSTPAQ